MSELNVLNNSTTVAAAPALPAAATTSSVVTRKPKALVKCISDASTGSQAHDMPPDSKLFNYKLAASSNSNNTSTGGLFSSGDVTPDDAKSLVKTKKKKQKSLEENNFELSEIGFGTKPTYQPQQQPTTSSSSRTNMIKKMSSLKKQFTIDYPSKTSQNLNKHVRSQLFRSQARRRSKTYSGEEIAAQLNKYIAESSSSSTKHQSANKSTESSSSSKISKIKTNKFLSNIIPTSSSGKSVTTNTLNNPSRNVSNCLRRSSLNDQLFSRLKFNRVSYGFSELLFTLDREGIIQNIGKFRIEKGDYQEPLNTTNTIHLENPESQTRWYFKYFLGRVHQNYVIEDKHKTIYFLSVVVTDANDRHIPQYRVILWTKNGSQKLTLPCQAHKPITVKQILNHFQIETDKSPKEVLDPDIQKELLVLEEQEGSINFKFGIVYAKHGQLTDDEMLSNEQGSPEFEKFLNLIGDRIRLKGWKRYRGGLDTTSDTTGDYSIYTIYEGHEIMFHVSTLLPYVKDSKQQLERKRHIGNDIVTIVFQDVDDNTEPDFTPSSARSQFQHIFALVVYSKKDNSYKLRIYSEQSVPPFGPSLPTPPVFLNHKEFREFLLVKLINGEKSAFNNSVFGKRRKRTIDAILTSLYNTYGDYSYKNKSATSSTGLGEALSDALTTSNMIGGSKRKEELRKAEFLRIGQNLKLQTIIKGDAPTSQLTTGIARKELWDPKIFLQSFEHSIICSDSWNNCLVLGTNNGVYVIDEAIPWETKQLFDKSVQLRQLDVSESYRLMLFCDFKGRMYVFRLHEFHQIMSDSNWDQSLTKTKIDCKEHKLDFINSCHVYAIKKQIVADSCNSNLEVVAACGKKLVLFQSKQSLNSYNNNKLCSSCQQQQQTNWRDTVNKSSSFQNLVDTSETSAFDVSSLFQVKKEINCSEVPNIVNIMDTYSGETYVLVAFKNRCEIIDEKNGDYLHIFQFNPLSTITSVVELYDNQQLEILVTHNFTSEFIKLENLTSNLAASQQAAGAQASVAIGSNANTHLNQYVSKYASYTFQWNTEPNYVLCVFPYVIGFSTQSIEVRLLVNGALINCLTMSNIKIVANKKEIFFSADHELFANDLSMVERYLNSFVISVNSTNTNNVTNSSSALSGGSDENSPPSSPSALDSSSSSFFPNTSGSLTTSATNSKSSVIPQFNIGFNSSTSSASVIPPSLSTQQQQQQQEKPPCSIYKISLDFLILQGNKSQNELFNFRQQLCENSNRTIKREISNYSSQFLFTDQENEVSNKQYSIYQKIISSNKEENKDSPGSNENIANSEPKNG